MTEPTPDPPREVSPIFGWAIEFGSKILRLHGPIGFTARLAGSWVSRFLAVQGFDRAVAIGAQAFTAIFPLLVVVTAIHGDGKQPLGEEIVDILDLEGFAADTTVQAFAPIGGADVSETSAGGLLLLVSVLSLSRAVQRVYERSHGLRPLGLKSTGYGLLWMLVMITGLAIGQLAYDSSVTVVRVTGVLSIGTVIALLTPYLLLMRRLAWRRLLTTAVMTAGGVLVFASLSSTWMSRTVEEWAARFGIIGVAFALLGWLTSAGFLLVVAATGGAVLDEQGGDPDKIADRLLEELLSGESPTVPQR